MSKRDVHKIMHGSSYEDTTCYGAIRNIDEAEKKLQQDAERKQIVAEFSKKSRMRMLKLEVNEKHKEYTIVLQDDRGHKTYVTKSYDDESEIPHVKLTSSGKLYSLE